MRTQFWSPRKKIFDPLQKSRTRERDKELQFHAWLLYFKPFCLQVCVRLSLPGIFIFVCELLLWGDSRRESSREWHESVKKLEELFKSLLIVAERMIESFSNYQTTLLFNMRAKNRIPLLLVAQCFKSKIQGVPTSVRKNFKAHLENTWDS